MPSSPKRRKERDRPKRRKRSRDRNEREKSPGRERRRSTERERDRDRDRERDRRKSRSRSHDRDRYHDKSMPSSSSTAKRLQMKPMVPESELEGKTAEEQEMLKTMGFCGFETTKGKKVEGNDVGEVHVILKRKYRQYMNRKGGFNRPLDFVA